MTIPVPFPVRPGERLRVTKDKPYGSDLMTGDLVSVIDVGLKVVGSVPVPVVTVSTAYGPQQLPFTVVERVDSLPDYTPAEPDDVVDAFFFRILGNDDELRDWAVTARTELAKNDPQPGQAAPTPTGTGGTAVADREERQVGESYTYEDVASGDELEVVYVEQTCPSHGREGGFWLIINEEDSVFIPAESADPLIRYLFTRRNHSRRPGSE